MVILSLTLLVITFYPVTALKCHSCAGADFLPSKVAQAMASMNLSTTAPTQGNCKGTSGSDVCTNGLFCVKKTVRYSIKYNSLNFNWDTYTKGCASVREDDAGVPTNTCYDISTTDKGGYTQTIRHCYCQKDLCNSSTTFLLNAAYILFVVHFIK